MNAVYLRGAETERRIKGSSYRCGHVGHKAATCTASPRCSLCAAESKPSAHMIGSTSCNLTMPKKVNRTNIVEAMETGGT